MTPQMAWQQGNSRYLERALADLRARLERLAASQQALIVAPKPVPAAQAPPSPPRSLWQKLSGAEQVPKPVTIDVVPSVPGPTASAPAKAPPADVSKPGSELAAASALTPPPALLCLSEALGLTPLEQDILLLCVAMELDPGIAPLCAKAQGDPNRAYPTFALALLFEGSEWSALSPEHALRYWRLIEISQPGNLPLTVSALRADERIVNYVNGVNYLDDRLSALVSPIDISGEPVAMPPSQQAIVDRAVEQLNGFAPAPKLPPFELLGSDSASKQLVASGIAQNLNLSLYRLPATLIPSNPADAENLARLWQREGQLLRTALYIDAADLDADVPGGSAPLARFVSRLDGVAFIDLRDRLADLPEGLQIEVTSPTPAEQEALWKAALREPPSTAPAALAGQFNLGSKAIGRIARQAQAEQSNVPLQDRLWAACLESTRPRLDMLAQRLDPKATWDDLVLPPAAAALVKQIASHVGNRSNVYQRWGFAEKMSRGFGISALFAGDSGTGKTMAAEVIANQLHLNLYRIDLSAVVSKYIGQTEKNLRKLFDAAEDGGAILFFDEADALFGKRSEVKDSHDRYANIEINYLLQRMEAYRGLAILATNMKSSLDQAFMRRLRFVVDFPFPSVAERKAMWQKVFPENTPKSGLDFDALAKLNLTGGNIHSVALNAAFLAAAQPGKAEVTQPLLLDAARTELVKLGRVVNELEFRRSLKTGTA